MNTEYALVNLLIRDPKKISDLARKGFSSKYFKNKQYGKVYDVILERWSKFSSSPTQEELDTLKFESSNEEIPHTIEHCIAVLYENKIKELMQSGIVASGEQLVASGPEASMELMRQLINNLPRLDNEKRIRELSETTDAFLERFHSRAINKGKIIGLEVGFPEIDLHTKGLMPQWLVVIQGRNGQYKSWVLSHWIKTMFMNKKRLAVFSCEMSLEEFETRIYALILDIDPRKLETGDLTYQEYNKLQEFLQDIKDETIGGTIVIDDNPGDLDMIDMNVKKLLEKGPLDAILIDAVYGLAAPGKSDTERFNFIAKNCKALAKKYEVPVIVTIQANRDFARANMNAKKETTGSGMSAYGGDAWNQYADIMFIIHQTDDHKPFMFSDFVMDKFRHGPKKDFMLHINLLKPVIEETDREKAIARIKGENPVAQSTADQMFAEASEKFTSTEDVAPEINIEFGEEEDTEDAD